VSTDKEEMYSGELAGEISFPSKGTPSGFPLCDIEASLSRLGDVTSISTFDNAFDGNGEAEFVPL
jgi:hypothetical protein